MALDGRISSLSTAKTFVIEHPISELTTLYNWILSGINQALLIASWITIQWMVKEYIVVPFAVVGVTGFVLIVVQWIFAIISFAPIGFYGLQLICTMGIRSWGAMGGESGREGRQSRQMSLINIFRLKNDRFPTEYPLKETCRIYARQWKVFILFILMADLLALAVFGLHLANAYSFSTMVNVPIKYIGLVVFAWVYSIFLFYLYRTRKVTPLQKREKSLHEEIHRQQEQIRELEHQLALARSDATR